MKSVRNAVLIAALCLPVAVASAQPDEGQNPAYRDGTGNDQVDRLNSAQLDENYRGPWYYPNPSRPSPSGAPSAYPPPAYPPSQPAPGY